jgi:hypothetical protein
MQTQTLIYPHKTGQFSTQLAIVSFATGTLLMLLTKAFDNNIMLVFIDLTISFIVFVFNTITLIYLLYFLSIEIENREYYLVKILI